MMFLLFNFYLCLDIWAAGGFHLRAEQVDQAHHRGLQPTQIQGGHVQDQGRADPHFLLVNKAANQKHELAHVPIHTSPRRACPRPR